MFSVLSGYFMVSLQLSAKKVVTANSAKFLFPYVTRDGLNMRPLHFLITVLHQKANNIFHWTGTVRTASKYSVRNFIGCSALIVVCG